MFRIVQALNNNVALVKNEQDDQAVVMGLGIVFQKKKGDLITPSKVEKVFLLKTEESKENFLTLLKNIPLDILTVTYNMIDDLVAKYHFPVQEYLYVSLTDHVYLVYQKLLKGAYQDSHLPDISAAYVTEFQMAQEAVAILSPNFKLKLATHKKFTRRLVVQAFFRVIVNPIFDKSDFFRGRFLGSFW